MTHIRAFVTKIFVVTSLAVGGIPRAVALLELLRPPPARVIISRRRLPDYADLFTPDEDDLAACVRAGEEYRWVKSA